MDINHRVLLEAHARLTIKEVLRIVGISRLTLYLRLKNNAFPAPVKVNGRNRWVCDEIYAYLIEQEAARG